MLDDYCSPQPTSQKVQLSMGGDGRDKLPNLVSFASPPMAEHFEEPQHTQEYISSDDE